MAESLSVSSDLLLSQRPAELIIESLLVKRAIRALYMIARKNSTANIFAPIEKSTNDWLVFSYKNKFLEQSNSLSQGNSFPNGLSDGSMYNAENDDNFFSVTPELIDQWSSFH